MTDESTILEETADVQESAQRPYSAEKAMPLSFRDAIVGSTTTVAVADNQQGLSQKLTELRSSLIRQQLEEQFTNSPNHINDISPEQRSHPETMPSSTVTEPEALGRIAAKELSKSRE